MDKKNCWEFKKCGREPGGNRANELGVCPSASEKKVDGVNGGKNGGRACWVIAGTFCGGNVQGSYAMKLINCMQCDFYQLVMEEEDANYISSKDILKKIGL